MSYENIDYEELYHNSNWFDSTTYELFTSRFLFMVFRHPNIQSGSFHFDYGSMILEKAFFWTMPQKDLKIAEEYWQDIRKHVLRNETYSSFCRLKSVMPFDIYTCFAHSRYLQH